MKETLQYFALMICNAWQMGTGEGETKQRQELSAAMKVPIGDTERRCMKMVIEPDAFVKECIDFVLGEYTFTGECMSGGGYGRKKYSANGPRGHPLSH